MNINLDQYMQMSSDIRKAMNDWMLQNDLPTLVFEIDYTPEQITCFKYKKTPRGSMMQRGGKPVIEKVVLSTVSPLPNEVLEFVAKRQDI